LKWVKGGRGLAASDASLGNSGKQGANGAPHELKVHKVESLKHWN